MNRLATAVLTGAAGAATFAVVSHLLNAPRPTDTQGLWDYWQPQSWWAVHVWDPVRRVGWWYQGTAKYLSNSGAQSWVMDAKENNWESSTALYRWTGSAWARA